MTLLQSVLLGIVQGITEFIPVSSSGHLVLFQTFFGVKTDSLLLFNVLVHFGTLIAICIAFHKDISHLFIESLRMIRDLLFNITAFYRNTTQREAMRYRKIIHNNYRRFLIMIIISTIPTAIIGMAAQELVGLASESLLVPGICFLITAVFLLISDVCESGKMIPKDISFSSAFLIGIAQGISTLPGLSRSGITIAACLISGYDKRFAVRYSFIMSVPAIIGAMVLELIGLKGSSVTVIQFVYYLIGAVVAGGVGYFSIRKMIVIVRQKNFRGFTIYCMVVGLISLAGYLVFRS